MSLYTSIGSVIAIDRHFFHRVPTQGEGGGHGTGGKYSITFRL